MTPVRVSAPTGAVVELDDLRKHLRVFHNEDDGQIQALAEAAVATFDGWRGKIGRCIRRQQWRVSLPEAGCYHLSYPDIVEVDGGEWDASQCFVTVPRGGDVLVTCELDEHSMPLVRAAIKMWVEVQYFGYAAAEAEKAAQAINAIIAPLRYVGEWR